MLLSVLRRILRDTQAAEEVLQDIFYWLWRRAADFDASRGSLPGMAAGDCTQPGHSRLRRHNPAAGEELVENAVFVPCHLESAVARQELLEGKSALETLPKEQRTAVELAYFEGRRTAKLPSEPATRWVR